MLPAATASATQDCAVRGLHSELLWDWEKLRDSHQARVREWTTQTERHREHA